jgi:hypothetical protein
LFKEGPHPYADITVQPNLCFYRIHVWVAFRKTSNMAAPTTFLLACCLLAGGMSILGEEPEKQKKARPCAQQQRLIRFLDSYGPTAHGSFSPSAPFLPGDVFSSPPPAGACPVYQLCGPVHTPKG